MAYNVYHNPQSVTIGGTAIPGVRAIRVAVRYGELHAAGDDDTHESVARHTVASTRGVVEGVDPVAADDVQGKTGTLSFVWINAKTGAPKTVTIADCSMGGCEARVSRDAASAVSIPFVAAGAPSIS